MRVLIAALALCTVPLAVALGQDPSQSRRCKHTTFTSHDARDADGRGHDGDADNAQGGDRDHDRKGDRDAHDPDAQDRRCDPPPPAPACGPTASLGGASSITGQVLDSATNVGQPGWCIQALVNGTAVLGALSDSLGNYTLSGLVGDTTTYLVCEMAKTGATQTFPAGVPLPTCPSGALGYSFQLNTGDASFVDFWDNP